MIAEKIEVQMIEVRSLASHDRDAWDRLYAGYAEFYKVSQTAEMREVLWGWLHDPSMPSEGLVAMLDGEVVGLAHFRAMPSPLRGQMIGFLDDLFIFPEHRGSGVAQALFDALAEICRQRQWPVMRWITRDDNYRARAVYDRLAEKTNWLTYELYPE